MKNTHIDTAAVNAMIDTADKMETTSMNTTIDTTNARSMKKRPSWSTRLKTSVLVGGALLFGVCAMPLAGQMQANPVAPVSDQKVASSYQGPTYRGGAPVDGVKMVPVAAQSAQNDYRSIARQAAANAGINPDLFVRQIQQESGFNPHAVSHAGAQGIAQFMPATAAGMGVNPHDPVNALNGGARLMAQNLSQFGGDYAKALAAYNAGPGAVMNAVSVAGGGWLSVMPAETQHYVHTIMG